MRSGFRVIGNDPFLRLGAGVGLQAGGGGATVPPCLVNDEFTAAIAAGSVDGTLAYPGGTGTTAQKTRKVTDTESKLSIADGVARFAGGKASPGFGNPAMWHGAQTRTVGRLMAVKVRPSQITKYFRAGWTTAQTSTSGEHSITINDSAALGMLNLTTNNNLGVYAANTNYHFIIPLRTAGAFFLVRGGVFTYPTLFGVNAVRNTATLYPNIQSYDATIDCDNERIAPETLWCPSPIASDSFNRDDGALGSTDGLGHAEGAAVVGTGGSGLAWTDRAGTFAIATNVATCSALAGGLGISTVTPTGNINNIRAAVKVTRNGGVAGLVIRYYNSANYIYCVYNGTQVVITKRVNNTETNLATQAATYAAGAELVVVADFSNFSVFYNGAIVGGPYVVANEVLISSRYGNGVGLYTTDITNAFDDFNVYDLGITSGCYESALSGLIGSIPAHNVYHLGDSKTLGTGDGAWLTGYPRKMNTDSVRFPAIPERNGVSGQTVAGLAARIDDDLANTVGVPEFVLINLGANDVAALPAEADWKTNLAYSLDALHTKWSSAQVYIMRPWRKTYLTECNSIATWIGDVIATRTWAHVGPDERVFLEGGDDGVTYTTDGTHPNAAGHTLSAAQWRTAIGY